MAQEHLTSYLSTLSTDHERQVALDYLNGTQSDSHWYVSPERRMEVCQKASDALHRPSEAEIAELDAQDAREALMRRERTLSYAQALRAEGRTAAADFIVKAVEDGRIR